jgi:hypothetical protein
MDWTYLPLHLVPDIDDIYWCYFPDTDSASPGAKLRPVLVRGIDLNLQAGKAIVHASYGTRTLKKLRRLWFDLIIDDPAELREVGLRFATRFDLDAQRTLQLIWSREFFCPPGSQNPRRIGRLNAVCRRRLDNRLRWRKS